MGHLQKSAQSPWVYEPGLTLNNENIVLLDDLQNGKLSFTSSGATGWVTADRVRTRHEQSSSLVDERDTYYRHRGRFLPSGQSRRMPSSNLGDNPPSSIPTSM